MEGIRKYTKEHGRMFLSFSSSFTLLICALLFIISCRLEFPEEKLILGVWLGSYQEYRGQKLPLPIIYDFQPGGKLLFKDLDENSFIEAYWKLENNRLWIDSTIFELIEIKGNNLLIRHKENRKFQRLASTVGLSDLKSAESLLKNTQWKSDSGDEAKLVFGEQILAFSNSEFSSSHCWRIGQYGNSLILYSREGEFCTGRIGRVRAIRSLSTHRMVWDEFNEEARKKYIFSKLPANESDLKETHREISDFQRCKFGYLPAYWDIAGAHEKGGNYIREYFRNELMDVEWDILFEGSIVLKFVINCYGETGDYQIEALDKQNQATICPESLKTGIFHAARTLKGWVPLEDNGEFFDAKKTLIFRIENSCLIAVAI